MISPNEIEPPRRPRRLMALVPFAVGILVGLIFRLLFTGDGQSAYSPMALAFIFFVPLVVGAVTVFIAERQTRRTWGYYARAGSVSNLLCVIGAFLVNYEGLICAIVIVPLFAVVGSVGGLLMGWVCRTFNRPSGTLTCLMVIPLFLGAFEHQIPLPNDVTTVERKVLISASPSEIWQQLLSTPDIQPHEVDEAWMYRIGVPLPVEGVTEFSASGPVRHVRMGKGVQFDQRAVVFEPKRRVRWTYVFTEESFPPNALDEHVEIGGLYFDVLDTEYIIEPIDATHSELRVRMSFRVSTHFNWYARPVAIFLVSNFEEIILGLYASRAEQATVVR